jgi:hypothetical protein
MLDDGEKTTEGLQSRAAARRGSSVESLLGQCWCLNGQAGKGKREERAKENTIYVPLVGKARRSSSSNERYCGQRRGRGDGVRCCCPWLAGRAAKLNSHKSPLLAIRHPRFFLSFPASCVQFTRRTIYSTCLSIPATFLCPSWTFSLPQRFFRTHIRYLHRTVSFDFEIRNLSRRRTIQVRALLQKCVFFGSPIQRNQEGVSA